MIGVVWLGDGAFCWSLGGNAVQEAAGVAVPEIVGWVSLEEELELQPLGAGEARFGGRKEEGKKRFAC